MNNIEIFLVTCAILILATMIAAFAFALISFFSTRKLKKDFSNLSHRISLLNKKVLSVQELFNTEQKPFREDQKTPSPDASYQSEVPDISPQGTVVAPTADEKAPAFSFTERPFSTKPPGESSQTLPADSPSEKETPAHQQSSETYSPPPPPPQKPAKSIEQVIGQRWMTWAGAVVLIFAAGFFVKYAFSKWLYDPSVRTALGVIFGIGVVVGGDRFVRKTWTALGQGLIGTGLGILYLSIFAGFRFDVMGSMPAFFFMVIVTALGLTLAVLHNSMATALLAVLGGFLTPVMVSTGSIERDPLFIYILILNLGVLGVAFFKKWRILDQFAFIATMFMVSFRYGSLHEKWTLAPTAMWFAGFFIVFLLLPFVYHIRKSEHVPIERFLMALGNGIWFFAFIYDMLSADHRHLLGFVALGMAACYIGLGTVVRKRIEQDQRALFGFIGLAVIFLTIAVPIHLKDVQQWIMLAWATEGPILLYLGYRYRYKPIRIAGFLVLVMAVYKVFVHFIFAPLHSLPFTAFLNARLGQVLFVAASLFSFAAIHHLYKDKANDDKEFEEATAGFFKGFDRALKIISVIGASYLTLLIFSEEFRLAFNLKKLVYSANCLLTLFWALGAVAFVEFDARFKSKIGRYTGLWPMVIAIMLALICYSFDWPKGHPIFFNFRFLSAMAALVCVFFFGYQLRHRSDFKDEDNSILSAFVLVIFGLFLLILFSIESFAYCRNNIEPYEAAKWSARMSLSIVWGLYAIGLIASGFWKRLRVMRYAGLGLFALTGVKLLLMDMAGLEQVYRIVSFLVMGILMIGASYLYHRLEKLIEQPMEGKQS